MKQRDEPHSVLGTTQAFLLVCLKIRHANNKLNGGHLLAVHCCSLSSEHYSVRYVRLLFGEGQDGWGQLSRVDRGKMHDCEDLKE
jgi:hypothetical protein